MTAAAVDSLELRRRVQALTVRAAQLEGVRKAAQEQNTQLTTDVSLAKGRMALGEEVGRVFDAMQQKAHERSVGSLETLLSAILEDVMPGHGKVRLLPQYKANSTHLDINLEKVDGGLEDILEGNGGALTNVVCTGLRFAALARTKARRTLILDEPDCWMKPTSVPAMVRTVAAVAVQAGVQTFYISHHESAFFDGYFNLVEFYLDGDKVAAKAVQPLVTDWENDEQPGIRRIELINVRRHEHTIVPCFPNANAFIGENNLGKSTALGSAFKAVAYGESDDTIIRRGCEEARIVIHLEQNKRIEWSRHLKRSPTVLYRLYEGDDPNPKAEGRPKSRNECPEWVTKELGIYRVDDLDIQVGNQKTPVFLLNDSAPKRAQILSVGREASYLKELMRGYEEVKTQDREVIKQGEIKLSKLKLRLGYLEKLPGAQEVLAKLHAEAEGLIKALEGRERLETVLRRLEEATNAAATLDAETAALAQLPECPELWDCKELERLIALLEKSQHLAEVPELPQLPEVPELHDLAELLRLGAAIGKAEKALKDAPELPPELPAVPELQDQAKLMAQVDLLARLLGAVAECEKEDASAAAALAAAEAEEKRLKEELGECPLCGHAFAHDEEHAHAQ